MWINQHTLVNVFSIQSSNLGIFHGSFNCVETRLVGKSLQLAENSTHLNEKKISSNYGCEILSLFFVQKNWAETETYHSFVNFRGFISLRIDLRQLNGTAQDKHQGWAVNEKKIIKLHV